MITHYYLTPYENPHTIAKHLKEHGTLTIHGNHQKKHEETVDNSTRIHYEDKSYSPQAFIDTYFQN